MRASLKLHLTITSKNNLLNSKNRVSGKIKAYEMPEDTAFEIDEPDVVLLNERTDVRKSLCHNCLHKNQIVMIIEKKR